jgi:L-ascorbate metabolism protein UlaG (beta-lactamase superfamily)
VVDRSDRFGPPTNRLINVVVVISVVLALAYSYLFGYPEPPVDPAWAAEPAASVSPGAVTVRFSGTATLLFSDGTTSWMTDGWFTRPGPLQTVLGKIAPDPEAIARGLAYNGVDQLSAVFPLHSHYDHAMDAPEVARRTGAILLGSAATANIGRGWGLPEAQIRVVGDGDVLRLGDFTLTVIESRHFLYPDADLVQTLLTEADIAEPLVPPVAAFDYKLGKAYILHVAHPRGIFLVIGSAGFIEGQLEGLDVDAVFLGVGGLGAQTDAYREQFWAESVGRVSPEVVIPIHWDSLTGPIDGPFTGEVRLANMLAPGAADCLAFLKDRERSNPGMTFMTLPRFAPVVLLP